MKDEIIISGLGIVTPYGNTLEDYFEGLLSKKKVEDVVDFYSSVKLDNPTGVKTNIPKDIKCPEEKILYMGEQAIKSALKDWDGNLKTVGRIALVYGSGLGLSDQLSDEYNTLDNTSYLSTLSEKLGKRIGLECEVIYIGNACAAGSQAISYAMDLLHCKCFDMVIAGGIDILSQMAYTGFLRLNAIDKSSCKPFDKNRKGIVVGEGAAFFILERSKINRENKVYCSLAGAGITNDAYHVVQIDKSGTEIKRAMEQALGYAGLKKEIVDVVIAHGTGTLLNDRTESEIFREYFKEHLWKLAIMSPKGAIGHTGGASGAMGVLTAIGCIKNKCVPPVLNLVDKDLSCQIPVVYPNYKIHQCETVMVNAYAFGGTNVVIICKAWNGEQN